MKVRRWEIIWALALAIGLTAPAPAVAAREPAAPCGAQVAPIGEADDARGYPAVLFVHGMDSSQSKWLGGDSKDLRLAIGKLGLVTMWTFDYSSHALSWVTDDHIGPALARAITCLAGYSGFPVTVVAHSMGGLATQFALGQSVNGVKASDHVGSVVTFGTPFRGSGVLSRMQGLRSADDVLPPNVADVLLALCSSVAGEGGSNPCAFLSVPEGKLGRALTWDSDEIKKLPAWPDSVPLLPTAGEMNLSLGIDLLGIKLQLPGRQSIGDLPVSVDSATAVHRRDGKYVGHDSVVAYCDVPHLSNFMSSQCGHNLLMSHEKLRQAAVEVIRRIRDTPPQQQNVPTVACPPSERIEQALRTHLGDRYVSRPTGQSARCAGDLVVTAPFSSGGNSARAFQSAVLRREGENLTVITVGSGFVGLCTDRQIVGFPQQLKHFLGCPLWGVATGEESAMRDPDPPHQTLEVGQVKQVAGQFVQLVSENSRRVCDLLTTHRGEPLRTCPSAAALKADYLAGLPIRNGKPVADSRWVWMSSAADHRGLAVVYLRNPFPDTQSVLDEKVPRLELIQDREGRWRIACCEY